MSRREIEIRSMLFLLGGDWQYPIWIVQDGIGQWEQVPMNHCAAVRIDSWKDLYAFAQEYCFKEEV